MSIMNKKNKIIVAFFAFIILFASVVLYKTFQVPEIPVHYHANFAIFIDGKKQDFSRTEFMHIEPCTEEGSEHSEEEGEKAELHDNIGDVVHVHDEKASWQDLFETMKYDIKSKIAKDNNSTRFYLNGNTENDVLEKVIGKHDRLLISIAADESLQKEDVLKREFEKIGKDASLYDSGKKTSETCGQSPKRSFFKRMRIAFGF